MTPRLTAFMERGFAGGSNLRDQIDTLPKSHGVAFAVEAKYNSDIIEQTKTYVPKWLHSGF